MYSAKECRGQSRIDIDINRIATEPERTAIKQRTDNAERKQERDREEREKEYGILSTRMHPRSCYYRLVPDQTARKKGCKNSPGEYTNPVPDPSRPPVLTLLRPLQDGDDIAFPEP